VFGVSASIAIVAFVVTNRHSLVVSLVSTDIARTAGIKTKRLNLVFLQMFALTVALGLRYLGVLLMGSLIIIPAATARRLSRNLTEMLALAAGVAVMATVLGSLLAVRLHRETGPLIVTVAAGLFLLALLRRDV
jgi:ABC-type Mn2+/Zn2+ transport system permease subunit